MFDKISIVNTTTLFFGAVVVITLANLGFGVWALVIRILFEACLPFVIYHFFIFKNFTLVSVETISPLMKDIRFGIEITFTRILGGWLNAADRLILGKYLPSEQFGGFTRSQQIALMPDALTLEHFNYNACFVVPCENC